MNKLIECVPNFSEGRDTEKINIILDYIKQVEQVTVLDVDPGKDTNRTVVTLVGPPEAIAEAAFQGIKIASEVIDMSKHSGTHPRMGATDVCPFIPINGVSEEECVELSKQVGKRVGEELNIPIYKIPSGEITNLPYLRHIGGMGKPVIMSTGMATLNQIEE